MDIDMNEAWKRRLWIWRGVLREMGWSDESIMRWARQYEDEAKMPGWFYHEPATYYLVPLLIPDDLRESLSPRELEQLARELSEALEDKSPTCYDSAGYDFRATATRVQEILKRHRQ